MPQSDPSRTEAATPKRIKKAREKGNVPKGQELSKVLVMAAGLIICAVYLGFMGKDIMAVFRHYLVDSVRIELDEPTLYQMFIENSYVLAKICLPIFLVVGLAAFASLRIQVGALWTTEVFTPKWDKIFNPVAGLKRMFMSWQTLIRLGKSLLQALVIGVVVYIVLHGEMGNLLPLFYAEPNEIVIYLLKASVKLVGYALVPMLLIALADAWYARWDYGENLKMTKQEIKDEYKQAEGDPQIKQKQKEKMFETLKKRMLASVPKADIVITNPTHLAVALSYNALEAPAPVLLAKGAEHLAEKIKEIAREHHIPIRENKPLARALYKECEIGDMIPKELYQAVAAMLAQLDKFRRR